jgi:hypothetical protein
MMKGGHPYYSMYVDASAYPICFVHARKNAAGKRHRKSSAAAVSNTAFICSSAIVLSTMHSQLPTLLTRSASHMMYSLGCAPSIMLRPRTGSSPFAVSSA